MVGLSYIPDLGEDNDLQFYKEEFIKIANQIAPIDYYSFKNRMILLNCLYELNLINDTLMPTGYSIGYYPSTILEIGIGKEKRFVNTSTSVLLGLKAQTVRYIGIDRQDRTYLKKFSWRNIILLEQKTKDVFKTDPWLDAVEIDLLHIDGGHSINDILIDWEFSKLVKDTGIIVLHDIKAHPGPKELIKAIDKNIYTVHELFLNNPKDFGMAVVYKKENDYGRIFD